MTGGLGAGTHSIEVAPPHTGDPEALRRAAHMLERCAADVDDVVRSLRRTVADLLDGGQWRGPAADAFAQRAVEPICQTLGSVGRALEQAAAGLRRGATALDEAQWERRKAEGMAIAGGVAVALTLFTFGISDVAAAEAAAGAAALTARAAMAAASAMRAVMLAMEDAAAAIRALSATMRAWGTQLGYAASMSLPRLVLSPVGAGAMGAAGTASLGDTQPSDLIQAFAMSYLEGKAGAEGDDTTAEARVAEVSVEERFLIELSRPRSRPVFPTVWGEGLPNRRGVGVRWLDPQNPSGNGVRIDQGDPHSPFECQRVDHVIVRHDGKVIGRDGRPIQGSISEDSVNAHIPLSEYRTWGSWYRP